MQVRKDVLTERCLRSRAVKKMSQNPVKLRLVREFGAVPQGRHASLKKGTFGIKVWSVLLENQDIM